MSHPKPAILRGPWLALLTLSAALSAWACTPPDSDRRIVLITLDSVRTDRLEAYGAPVSLMPRVDRWAAGAAVFEHAVTPAPLTLPALAGALTGRMPSAIGVVDDEGSVVAGDAPRLAARLLAGGWATGAFVNAPFIDLESGLLEGFRRASNPALARDTRERGARALLRDALEFLDMHRKVPAFAWVHIYDTHYPYVGDGVTGRGEDRYNSALGAADRALGLFLDALERKGLADSAVLIVASDHGEGLGEGGERTHGLTLTPATVRVPLMVDLPGREGRRVAAPASLLDLAPTVAHLAGLEPAPAAEPGTGRSLVPDLEAGGETPPGEPVLVTESFVPFFSYHWPPLQGRIVDGEIALLEPAAAWPAAPDLGPERPNDPGEQVRRRALEVAGRVAEHLESGRTDEARSALADWPAATAGAPMAARLAAALDLRDGDGEAALAQLRQAAEQAGDCAQLWSALAEMQHELGRPSATAWQEAAQNAGDRVRFAVRAAESLLREGQPDQALATIRDAVAGRTPSATLDLALGRLYLEAGRAEEAQGPLADAATRSPGSSTAYRLLARAAEATGSLDGALSLLEEARRIDPQDLTLHRDLGDLRARAGQLDAAEAAWRRALGAEPAPEPQATLQVAENLLRLGLLDPAAARVEAIRQQHPDDPQAHYIMAQVALARRQPGVAQDELLAALRTGGEQPEVYYGLARSALMEGDESSALAYLDRVFAADDPVLRAALQADLLLTAPGRHPRVSAAVEAYLAGGAPPEDSAP